jgi:predicted permease
MDVGNVLTSAVMLPDTRYPTPEKQAQFYSEVLGRVRALPGVETASLTSGVPLDNGSGHWPISIEGRPTPLASQQPSVEGMFISPGFLKTFRIGMVSGRDIADTDIKGRPPVILISQSMARHFWPDESPLGARVKSIFFPDLTFEVVGVVKDVKLDGLDVSTPVQVMYLAFDQVPNRFMSIVLRTSGSPAMLAGPLVKAIHEIDPEQPVVNVRTMDEVTSGSIERRRFTMLLLAAFAGLALLLAAVGIYSVLAYAVRQRVREIGIRLALGAQPSEVLRLMLMSGLRPTVLGIAVGVAGAAAIARTLTSFFVGISGTDPLTFAGVSSLVLVVGLSASLIPAWRATTIDPIRTLRDE